jgi:hypothetical protein
MRSNLNDLGYKTTKVGHVNYDREKRAVWTFRTLYKAHEEVFLRWQDDFWGICGFSMLVPGSENKNVWKYSFKNKRVSRPGEIKTLPEALVSYHDMLKKWYIRTLDMAIAADNFMAPRFKENGLEYTLVIDV